MENIVLTEAVFYILLSLNKPMHGYGIIQNVIQLSNNRLILAAGTLYGAINTLLEKGWIEFAFKDKDDRKKEYIITGVGKNVLNQELDRLKELVKNGNEVLERGK